MPYKEVLVSYFKSDTQERSLVGKDKTKQKNPNPFPIFQDYMLWEKFENKNNSDIIRTLTEVEMSKQGPQDEWHPSAT